MRAEHHLSHQESPAEDVLHVAADEETVIVHFHTSTTEFVSLQSRPQHIIQSAETVRGNKLDSESDIKL